MFDDIDFLKAKLDEVRKVIDTELQTDEEDFNKVISRYFNEKAKMIRPAFVLISAMYKKSYVNNEDIKCAAAAEMLHVATLIHDDIIDNAKTRRGLQTIHDEYDAGYAVICGDMLYAKSYQLLFNNSDFDGVKYISNKVYDMAFGEVKQYVEKFNYHLSIDKYLDIISKKSAALFQSNLMLGSQLAKVSKYQQELLVNFGLNYGLMFQVQDDILDVISYEMHKPVNSDLKRGVYTLPVLVCAQNYDEFSPMLKDFEDGKITFDKLDEFLKSTDAIEISKNIYNMFYENCCEILNNIENDDVRYCLNYILHKTRERLV